MTAVFQHIMHNLLFVFFLSLVGNFLCLGDCHIDNSSELFGGRRSHLGFSIVNSNVSSIKQMATKDAYLKVDFLTEELLACGFDTVVIFTDNMETNIAEAISIYLYSHNILVVHYDLNISDMDAASQQLEHLIWSCYHDRNLRNFAWIMGQPQIFVDVAQKIFQTHSRGYAAMLPHSMKLLIVCESSVVRTMEQQLSGILLDNIAIVIVHDVHIETVQTLMWREHRQREIENITDSVLGMSMVRGKTCKIFPNLDYGMNGRMLESITKTYLRGTGVTYITSDPVSKELRYAGCVVDVIDLLAFTLNFTYVFISEPENDKNITWYDLLDVVGRGDVDLGATFYLSTTAGYYNHTVTDPILEVNLSGVYVNKDSHMRIGLLSFIDLEVCVCFLSCLLFTLFLYVWLTFLSKRIETSHKYSDRDSKLQQNKHAAHLKEMSLKSTEIPDSPSSLNELTSPQSMMRKRATAGNNTSVTLRPSDSNTECSKPLAESEFPEHSQKTRHSKEKISSGENVMDLFFRFVGSVFMQGILPGPRSLPARLLLFFWWIMLIVVAVTVTAKLTVSLIKRHEEVPFTTFNELFAREDYRWGMITGTSFIPVMRNAPEGSTLRKLIDGIDKFVLDDPSVLSEEDVLWQKIQSEKFVALLLSVTLEDLMSTKAIPDLVIMKEVVISTSAGLLVPKHSEFGEVISKQTNRMRDTGIITLLCNKHKQTQEGHKENDNEADQEMWAFIRTLVFVIGSGLGVSLIVLIVEFLYVRLMASGTGLAMKAWLLRHR